MDFGFVKTFAMFHAASSLQGYHCHAIILYEAQLFNGFGCAVCHPFYVKIANFQLIFSANSIFAASFPQISCKKKQVGAGAPWAFLQIGAKATCTKPAKNDTLRTQKVQARA